jgi:hypothetical protein
MYILLEYCQRLNPASDVFNPPHLSIAGVSAGHRRIRSFVAPLSNQAASGSCPGCYRCQTQLCSLGLCGRGSDVIVDSRFDGGEKEFFSELREEAEPPKFVFYRVFEFSKAQLDAAVA